MATINKKDIFIGIDGGGTKSKAIVQDSDGNNIGQARGGPSNIRLSVEGSWQSIIATVKEALHQANLSLDDDDYNFHIGLGLAGCEVPEACEKFLNTPHPFTTISLHKDAYTACLGAHNGNNGSIIIIGTGVNGFQICDHETTQVSGWGFPHDDKGGGAWLGLKAVTLTLQHFDGRLANGSPLLDMILHKFEDDFAKLVSWANRSIATNFAEIAPLVVQQFQAQDPLATMLVQRAATKIDQIGATLVSRTKNNQALPCSLFGGLAPFIEPLLCEELKSRLVPRKHDAAIGAIIAHKKHLKIP